MIREVKIFIEDILISIERRDILIHQYFGVNLERVWTTIEEDLPNLKKQISKILEKL